MAWCRSSMLSSTAWPTRWRADGPDLHVVLLQHLPLVGTVVVLVQGLVHLEVVAPAGQLQAVEAVLAEPAGQLLHRQVGPLAGEHGNRSCHFIVLHSGWLATVLARTVRDATIA